MTCDLEGTESLTHKVDFLSLSSASKSVEALIPDTAIFGDMVIPEESGPCSLVQAQGCLLCVVF